MISTRKLQLEIEEKNDIISILREELESTKEQNDKFRKENIQLLKDSNKVKFLQDELDCLQDKVARGEQLELEIERLKEKISREQDFLKIRIDELEDDKRKAREECKQFEDKWLKAEATLSRVVELEEELNKWKSFSHELESERNSIQNKLLESIEQETKLSASNKQVECELMRLRALIKSYEEQRDEEQASNSLIMSVADLKQLDQAFSQQQEPQQQQQQQQQPQQLTADSQNPQDADKLNRLLELDEELASNKRLIADLRQDLACEKSLTLRLTNQLTSFTKQIKNLDKQYFPMHNPQSNQQTCNNQEVEAKEENEVVEDEEATAAAPPPPLPASVVVAVITEEGKGEGQEIKVEAEESSPQKSVTSFKYQQPKDFNQNSPSNSEALRASAVLQNHVGFQEEDTKPTEKNCVASALPNRSTPISEEKIDTQQQLLGTTIASSSAITASATTTCADDCRSNTPTQSGDKVPSASVEVNPISAQNIDGSHKEAQQLSTSASVCAKPKATESNQHQPSQLIKVQLDQRVKQFKSGDSDLLTDGLNTNSDQGVEVTSNGTASNRKQREPNQLSKSRSSTSNFVRNSLPSRSVNFGHSKSSALLERIRASVKATTTTNTTSSFNEQTQNVVLSQPSQPVLNCSLDHPHSERCFIAKNMVRLHNLQDVSSDNLCHSSTSHIQPSRQLNALIDPVSQEQLMMSMMHQNHNSLHHHHHLQQPNQMSLENNMPVPNATELNGQQIAHLASLHHQHYYHHLQHMHHLHQMHHKHYLHLHYHRLRHKYQQQQTAGAQNEPNTPAGIAQQDNVNCNQAMQRDLCEPIYSGGSQFQAPIAKLDQEYANMAANNNINLINEQQQKYRTRLVNSNNNNRQEQTNSTDQRESPVRLNHRQNCQKTNNEQSSHYTLPQIAEVNGLPTVDLKGCFQHSSARKQQRNAQVVMTSEALTTATKQHCSSTNGSPSSSSSSPTSSTSSHLSASSASSSSSLNSLSTSNAHLKRSVASRHTTTDHSRRQFSVERELVGALPMTATLSRVGSCRANRSADEANLLRNLQLQDAAQMRTPVKSKQPSMRTSKILNIGQQTPATIPPQHHLTPQHNQQQHLQHQPNPKEPMLDKRSPSAERDMTSLKLASNLANIRLNDSLAFTSLRAPKSSASGSGMKRMLTENNNIIGQNTTPIVKLPTTSNPVEKRRQIGNAANDNGGGNKSSVWFEYGCV